MPDDGVQINDEHAGKGGRYVVDPVTGLRQLVARTQPAGTLPEPVVQTSAQPDEPTTQEE